MSFTTPLALLLLFLLPALAVAGWPRLAYRRRRDTASLLLRLLIVALLVLALAGAQVHRAADKLAVVFLLDVSDSVSPAQQSAAVEYVRQAAAAMGADDQAAVIVFGADALVEVPITGRLELVQIGSDPVRLNTDLAEAMRLGLALFPADAARRMVILSDGRPTVGDAEEVARLAAATNVQVDTVLLAPEDPAQQIAGPEVLVAGVDVPATVNQGERFSLTASLATNRPDTAAEVRVLSRGQIVHQREVLLQPGVTREVFDVVAPQAGFIDFEVIIEPRGADTFYQNNRLAAFTQVSGPPRALLVTSDEREIATLRAVLAESGLQVDVRGPRELPIGLAALSSYNSVILANVSATELSLERMETLQAYVRDLGGGLAVIGGPNSYGVGGYFETPLEETLPVEMRLRDQERVPQLTLLFVIDRSGSMELSSAGGVSNLELAKEAVVRSFDLLNDNDRTGVLSFDVSAYYVLDIQEVGDAANRQRLRDLVGSLRPGGGTNIYQGVLAADQVLRGDPSELKHIILLTDGGADPTGIADTVAHMNQTYGVTLSVVAIGQDYAPWLVDVAAAGGGLFHLAYDISTIPAIFTAETLLATRSYISEEPFVPTIVARHPIVGALTGTPELRGYVATTEKDTATVILRGPQDDPILAVWQYGLGRAAAFTSDASSRWAADWVTWDGYADFWNQAVRWTITEGGTGTVEARVVERGEEAVLTVDARDSRGNFLNGLVMQAAVVGSDLLTTTLTLQQTAPGRYETALGLAREGAYFITVAGSTAPGTNSVTSQSVMQTTGWVLGYSAEYALGGAGTLDQSPADYLRDLAAITGGGSLRENPAGAFAHNLDQERAAQPVWAYLVLTALLLLPLDVAVRRLIITGEDVARARARLSLRRTQPDLGATGERFERLLGAKGRASGARAEETPPEAAAMPGAAPPPEPIAPPPLPPRPPSAEAPAASRPERGPRPIPRPPAERARQDETLASRLLERRRTRHDDDDR